MSGIFKQLDLFVSHSDWIQKYLFGGAKNPDDLEKNVSVHWRIRMSLPNSATSTKQLRPMPYISVLPLPVSALSLYRLWIPLEVSLQDRC